MAGETGIPLANFRVARPAADSCQGRLRGVPGVKTHLPERNRFVATHAGLDLDVKPLMGVVTAHAVVLRVHPCLCSQVRQENKKQKASEKNECRKAIEGLSHRNQRLRVLPQAGLQCTEHAMQGSKLCNTRRTSIGSFSFLTGVPADAFSRTPGTS